jgi:hypothetical protein
MPFLSYQANSGKEELRINYWVGKWVVKAKRAAGETRKQCI